MMQKPERSQLVNHSLKNPKNNKWESTLLSTKSLIYLSFKVGLAARLAPVHKTTTWKLAYSPVWEHIHIEDK